MAVYRNDVDALAARHAALAGEVEEKRRELDEAARLLADAKARARLPVLDNIRVASPCTADWAKMTGDDRVRHCAECDKDVFNLSAMTRDEAQELITAKAGKLCARYFQRKDGTILLADCTVGVRRRRRRRWVAAGAAALLVGGAGAASLVVRGPRAADERAERQRDEGVTMGMVASDPVAIEQATQAIDEGQEIMGGIGPATDPLPPPPPKRHARSHR